MTVFKRLCINGPATSLLKHARYQPVHITGPFKRARYINGLVTCMSHACYRPVEKTGLYKPVNFYLCIIIIFIIIIIIIIIVIIIIIIIIIIKVIIFIIFTCISYKLLLLLFWFLNDLAERYSVNHYIYRSKRPEKLFGSCNGPCKFMLIWSWMGKISLIAVGYRKQTTLFSLKANSHCLSGWHQPRPG